MQEPLIISVDRRSNRWNQELHLRSAHLFDADRYRPSSRMLGRCHLHSALDEVVFAAKGIGTWHSIRNETPERCMCPSEHLPMDICHNANSIHLQSAGQGRASAKLKKHPTSLAPGVMAMSYLLIATGRAEVMVDPIANTMGSRRCSTCRRRSPAVASQAGLANRPSSWRRRR